MGFYDNEENLPWLLENLVNFLIHIELEHINFLTVQLTTDVKLIQLSNEVKT
jgi:hypothetical protein